MSDRRIGTVVKAPSIWLRELVERATGVEPATSSLGSWHSTTELRPLSGVELSSSDAANASLAAIYLTFPMAFRPSGFAVDYHSASFEITSSHRAQHMQQHMLRTAIERRLKEWRELLFRRGSWRKFER